MLAPVRVHETEATQGVIDGRKSKDELTYLGYFAHKESKRHASQAPPDVSMDIKVPSVAAAQEPTSISSQLLLLPPEIILHVIPMLPYPEYVAFQNFFSPSLARSPKFPVSFLKACERVLRCRDMPQLSRPYFE